MKQNRLTAFFTNSMYRWAVVQEWKMNLCALPGIKHLISWRYMWIANKKMKNMTGWEQHVYIKNIEKQSEKFCFVSRLTRLSAFIMSEVEYRSKEEFLKCKQEVLESDYINSRELSEFKQWVEKITSEERDYTKINNVIEMLAKEE